MSTVASSDISVASKISRHAPAGFFIAALATAVPVWWLVAIPILSGAPRTFEAHLGHALWTYAHAASGTVMLFSGAAALWIGWTRKAFRFHRLAGGAYLLTGLSASVIALSLNIVDAHDHVASAAPMGALAAAWLVAAAMAFRAIRNRRIESHKHWVIRSYVLTWSFVFCRGVSLLPLELPDGLATSLMWLAWIVPLLICEVLLQWSQGSARRAQGP